MSRPFYFACSADFRAWLEKNHASYRELLVGFYKKSSGEASITYPAALDEALCFGWIARMSTIMRIASDSRPEK